MLEYPKGVAQAYWNVSGVRLRVKSSKDGDLQSTKTTLTVTPGVGVAMGNGKCQRTVWTVTSPSSLSDTAWAIVARCPKLIAVVDCLTHNPALSYLSTQNLSRQCRNIG